ncbi:MAG: T9SS type A sorting domain-containing protein [Winogradskyella sp.]|uniref:T9SS type A sorting domain-containing protein n=1 Tax=Winogradskyella sp. TaxID=1883156 RepID=UPI00385C826E
MKTYYTFILLSTTLLLNAQNSITSSIVPDLSAYGASENHSGEGEYEIFLSSDNILDKPIIVVDGFDPGDTRDITALYNSLDFTGTSGTENLADLVRAEGFDVVILNFPTYLRTADNETIDGGADFMERNAMVLVELINLINTDKAGNNGEPNVIIGPSMGGIISRYALNYMEGNSLDADTRLYISFDSPHHGANVPIGLQHQLNFLAFNDTNPVAEVQPLINGLLKSPAARQLLTDHLEAHLSGEDLVTYNPALTLPIAHPFRTIFNTNINSFTASGFPETVRNVAIINGSGVNNSYFAMGNSGPTVTNDYSVISTTLSVPVGIFTSNIIIDVNFTPAAGITNTVSSISIQLFGAELDGSEAQSEAYAYSDGIDAASGGLFDLGGLTNGIGAAGGVGADFVNALTIDKFNFIPSISALALEFTNDEIDWHSTIDLSTSPFANSYLPTENEPHVQLTQGNVNFALDEILNPPLSLSDENRFAFQLEKNPIRDELVVLSNSNSNTDISIIDLTGKTVFKSRITLGNRTTIPLNLDSGFYILNLHGENNARFTTKFVVNK